MVGLYQNPKTYLKGPDGMKNEATMWYVAAGLLMQELAKQNKILPFGGLGGKIGRDENAKSKPIKLLDLCSGPGNFPNHLSFIIPKLNVTCVDINKNFIDSGRRSHPDWKFYEADAATLQLPEKFDVITVSSGYHHIAHDKKADFIKVISKHLKPKAVAIMCENFLPSYGSLWERKNSVEQYYKELIKFYKAGNATKKALEVIEEVRRLELAGVEEYKVDFRTLKKHIRQASLDIETEIPVWQPKRFVASHAGSWVLVLRKNK